MQSRPSKPLTNKEKREQKRTQSESQKLKILIFGALSDGEISQEALDKKMVLLRKWIELDFSTFTQTQEQLNEIDIIYNNGQVLLSALERYKENLSVLQALHLDEDNRWLIQAIPATFREIVVVLNQIKLKNNDHNNEQLNKLIIKLSELHIKINLFIRHHCTTTNNELVKFKMMVSNEITAGYEALTNANACLNHFTNMSRYLSEFKKELVTSNSSLKGSWLLYYLYSSSLACKNNNLTLAKDYFLKSKREVDKTLDSQYPISLNFIDVAIEFIKKCTEINNTEMALFFTKITKDTLTRNINVLKYCNTHRTKENDFIAYPREIKHSEKYLSELNPQIAAYKKNIFDKKLSSLRERYKDISFTDQSTTNNKVTSYHIGLVINEDLKNLSNNFERAGIIFETVDGVLIIDKVIETPISKIIKSIHARKKLNQAMLSTNRSVTQYLADTQTIQKESATEPNDLKDGKTEEPTESLPKPEKIKTRKALSTNNEPAPDTTKDKIITWGDDFPIYQKLNPTPKVFKLYGSIAKRHYVFINKQLSQALKETNPLARLNLKKMCERGKLLGNSKGKKGFVFIKDIESITKKRNKNAETTVTNRLKVKDCKKNYRFFAETAKIVKEENGKEYTLMQINGWQEDHHKNKKIIYFK